MKLVAPEHYVKTKSDICIVCGYDPKTRENWGCRDYFKELVNNGRHQYIYLTDPKDL